MGLKVNLFNLKPEDIEIMDIAHSLAHQCRFNGHCDSFYSVAEHSMLTARFVSDEAKMYALLHDATEAYMGDIVKPIKEVIPELKHMEEGIWRVIRDRFRLDDSHKEEVKEADLRMLCTEQHQFKLIGPFSCCENVKPYSTNLIRMHPYDARKKFMLDFLRYERKEYDG